MQQTDPGLGTRGELLTGDNNTVARVPAIRNQVSGGGEQMKITAQCTFIFTTNTHSAVI